MYNFCEKKCKPQIEICEKNMILIIIKKKTNKESYCKVEFN